VSCCSATVGCSVLCVMLLSRPETASFQTYFTHTHLLNTPRQPQDPRSDPAHPAAAATAAARLRRPSHADTAAARAQQRPRLQL
jgi:hypothetical protein